MPIYSYRCTSCGRSFDRQQSYNDDAITDCPYCDAKGSVKKVWGDVPVIFHGHGYYCTDHQHEGGGCDCSSCPHHDN